MDFERLNADVNKILNKHYTSGRGGKSINKVVVHYNAGNLTIEGCYSVWQTREASAHYQVESRGRIGQLVHDKDTAWHCGVFSQNQQSIGIEHANQPDGTITDACLDAGAHLVAAVCKKYGLGRPEWLKNVFPHRYFKPTSCPGQIYGSQKDAYIKRAQAWYDSMVNGSSAPSAGSSSSSPGLAVDGLWGSSTTLRAQQVLRLQYKDGKVSRQNPAHKSRMPGCTLGWEWTGSQGKGSPLIKALQKKWGATADGVMGPDTINAMIGYYMARGSGATVKDGKLDRNSKTIKQFQRELNAGRI